MAFKKFLIAIPIVSVVFVMTFIRSCYEGEIIEHTYATISSPGAKNCFPNEILTDLEGATDIRYYFDMDASRSHSWATLSKETYPRLEASLKKMGSPLTSENFKTHYGCNGNKPFPVKNDGSDLDPLKASAYALETSWGTTWIFMDIESRQIFLCTPSKNP